MATVKIYTPIFNEIDKNVRVNSQITFQYLYYNPWYFLKGEEFVEGEHITLL